MYSAREELFESLTGGGRHLAAGEAESANGLIDNFAHELAEKIRNSEELRDLTDDHMGDCNAAADLIDPAMKR